jgi:hypothetical protein
MRQDRRDSESTQRHDRIGDEVEAIRPASAVEPDVGDIGMGSVTFCHAAHGFAADLFG